jgi:hypothetical protein
MSDNSEPLAAIAAENPEVLASLGKALASVQAERAKQRIRGALD